MAELVATFAEPLAFFVGDRKPTITCTLRYETGNVFDLNSASAVTVYISRVGANRYEKTFAATVTDATSGVCTFTLPSAFTSPGQFEGQLELTVSGAPLSTQKFPIDVEVGTPES